MEWLKAILGEELYAQVAPKLTAAGDKVKLANLADGGYVDKGKFTDMEARAKTAEKTVGERDAQIVTLSKVDPAALQATIDKLTADNATAKAEAEKQIAEMKFDGALTGYLGGHKFTSNLAKEAAIAKLKASGIKLGEDGKLLGADDVMNTLKKDNPGAFEAAPKESSGLFNTPPANTPAAGSMAAALTARYAEQGLKT